MTVSSELPRHTPQESVYQQKEISGSPTFTEEIQDNEIDEECTLTSISGVNEWELQPWQRRKRRRQELRKNSGDASSAWPSRPSSHNKQLRRKPAIIGTSEGSTGLAVAQPRISVSLFISRLSPEVNENDLKTHVANISGEATVTCEKLEVKHNNYISFKISVNDLEKSKIGALYQSANWPKGIVVREWYDRKI